jgi:dipeptidyl aminopeptidase/acylaminoacyl peptidase
MTIYNEGPRDPGTYYLLREGRIESIGSRQPLLEGEELADIEYITYESRDGRKIPGFLTVPKGEPPYPLIVIPHGGPFVAESVTYNERAQMFANNGYLVLQPQYRGSQNYGLDFYHAAFEGIGEIGRKMQDDKDDGAMYLVEKGLANPDRIAMYGGSYGGYASLVAASRTPQIYQCVIAAAVVSDPILQTNYLRFDLSDGWENEEFIETWDNAVSPVDEAAKVNVPILIIHGSVDQRTPPEQARRYMKQLDKYGKFYKFVELKNADHFTNTWTYDHKKKMYGAIIDFLKNDCGRDGLQAKTSD